MNRRNFIGGLFKGIIAASVAPQVIVNATTKWQVTKSGLWIAQEADLYNKLPFYIAKMQFKFTPEFETWSNFQLKWKPNLGETKRIIVPHILD